MSLQNLKRTIMITQMSSASVSLVASVVIAAFVAFGKDPTGNSNNASTRDAKNGRRRARRRDRPRQRRHQRQREPTRRGICMHLQTIRDKFYNPYRRLIFGLSIADIFLSFAILTGPFMIRSDSPQALWGLGNVSTCNINGFLALLGSTAVPMYTLCICIYYVCKIKGKMTDEQFASKIEKKMHIFIIVFNVAIYLTAMGMGVINPGIMGNVCAAASYPTGCRLYPEYVGECDPFIAEAANIFIIISSIVVPFLCLIGIIGCMALLFWNVLMMDQISGRPSEGGETEQRDSTGYATGTRRCTRLLREIPLDEQISSICRSSDDESDDSFLFPVSTIQTTEISHAEIRDPEDVLEVKTSQTLTDPKCGLTQNHDSNHEIQEYPKLQNNFDLQTISRIYKRELVTQACCYVAVFCCTIFINSTINIKLIFGYQPNKALMMTTTALFPLGGFFNILVYTRPNVASFLRKCPECLWYEAFWLVLKAGGEVPDENEWRNARQQQGRSCCCIFCPFFASRRDDAPGASSVVSQVNVPDKEAISDLQFGMPSQPVAPDEELPDSNLGIDGLSQSIESDNVAHRVTKEWSHLVGEDSKMAAIQEEKGDSNSGALKSSEILDSEDYSVDAMSTLSLSDSQKKDERRKDDFDAMWEATFDRVKKY